MPGLSAERFTVSRETFATAATNALGQSESWQHDARFELPTSHTGPNGLTTTWTYDPGPWSKAGTARLRP